jgi:hypothetical protein
MEQTTTVETTEETPVVPTVAPVVPAVVPQEDAYSNLPDSAKALLQSRPDGLNDVMNHVRKQEKNKVKGDFDSVKSELDSLKEQIAKLAPQETQQQPIDMGTVDEIVNARFSSFETKYGESLEGINKLLQNSGAQLVGVKRAVILSSIGEDVLPTALRGLVKGDTEEELQKSLEDVLTAYSSIKPQVAPQVAPGQPIQEPKPTLPNSLAGPDNTTSGTEPAKPITAESLRELTRRAIRGGDSNAREAFEQAASKIITDTNNR